MRLLFIFLCSKNVLARGICWAYFGDKEGHLDLGVHDLPCLQSELIRNSPVLRDWFFRGISSCIHIHKKWENSTKSLWICQVFFLLYSHQHHPGGCFTNVMISIYRAAFSPIKGYQAAIIVITMNGQFGLLNKPLSSLDILVIHRSVLKFIQVKYQ